MIGIILEGRHPLNKISKLVILWRTVNVPLDSAGDLFFEVSLYEKYKNVHTIWKVFETFSENDLVIWKQSEGENGAHNQSILLQHPNLK